MSKIVTTHYPIALDRLPSSWASTTVGEVFSDIQPGFASGIHNQEGIGIPHLRPMNINRDGNLDLTVVKYVSGSNPLRVKVGDVLFNNTNSAELTGKTAYVGIEGDLAFSNHMTRLRPAEGVDPRFAAYQLHFLWMTGYFQHRCTHHVNQASVASTTLAETVPFAVAPSNEQLRIVGEIEKQFTRLDAAVAALKRVEANLKRYRAAVLKAACEGRLVPTEAELARREGRTYESAAILLRRILGERQARWETPKAGKRTRYREPAGVPDNPRLPEGWTWASIDQTSLLVTKGTSPGWQGFEYVERGIPFVRSQNVRWGQLDLSDLVFVEPRFNQTHPNSIIRTGDVLLNLVGASVGRSAIATEEIHGANTNQAVGIIRLVPNGVSNTFLVLYLLSPAGQAHITRTKADVARANFNLDDIRPTPFPLPPPAEQVRIIAEADRRLSVVNEVAVQVAVNLRRAETQRESILKSAFRGELVAQAPDDEPATVLLERIQSERRASPANAVSSKRKGEILRMSKHKENNSRSIVEALRDRRAGMSPEALLKATGHGAESIDDFYAELKQQVEAGSVEEIRSGDNILLRASIK